jgi:glycosyltransferase involved in cell wall biosynthesis
MTHPLVSVICLCYNHGRFVNEAIESVVRQSYPNIEVIIVDDASTDNSVGEIKSLLARYPQIKFIPLERNQGICKAFNIGFSQSKGQFIVDFATDDIFHSDRIARQVDLFSRLDDSFGVIFTDAVYIDVEGKSFRNHIDYLFSKGLIKRIPEGDIYTDLLQTYFVASPTMLVRRVVLEQLGGYDENLSYEDFDFWVRSSRRYKYAFLNEKLTFIRRSTGSLSSGLYVPGDPQLHSTYLVCLKAKELNRTHEEKLSLVRRVRYELRQSVLTGNHHEAELFYSLLKSLEKPRILEQFVVAVGKLRVPLNPIRKMYHRWRYG